MAAAGVGWGQTRPQAEAFAAVGILGVLCRPGAAGPGGCFPRSSALEELE